MFHQGCEPQKELELFLQRDKVQGDFFEIGFDPKKGRFLKVNQNLKFLEDFYLFLRYFCQ